MVWEFSKTFSAVRDPDAIHPSGLFAWDLSSDRLYGDPSVATHFGLEPVSVARGLSLQTFLSRVHDDDRPGVARGIHDAIITGDPQYCSYRTRSTSGLFKRIHVVGQCFRDDDDVARLYAGIVFDPAKAVACSLGQICVDALSLAESQGQDEAAAHLALALRALRPRH